MVSAIGDLVARLIRETVIYRKGAEVEQRQVGAVRVVEVYAMPPVPEHGEIVDVHFLAVGFTEAACDRDGFIADVEAACADNLTGTEMPLDLLGQGPSYIGLGAWLGSQEVALRLLGLGEHYDCWRVVTPERLGITGPEADQIAGTGFVMPSGWYPVLSPAE